MAQAIWLRQQRQLQKRSELRAVRARFAAMQMQETLMVAGLEAARVRIRTSAAMQTVAVSRWQRDRLADGLGIGDVSLLLGHQPLAAD
jgi:hypothetical protein